MTDFLYFVRASVFCICHCDSNRPDCHHESRERHHCHFGRCPPCRQTCGQVHDTCPHQCTAPCHTAVWQRQQVLVNVTTLLSPVYNLHLMFLFCLMAGFVYVLC